MLYYYSLNDDSDLVFNIFVGYWTSGPGYLDTDLGADRYETDEKQEPRLGVSEGATLERPYQTPLVFSPLVVVPPVFGMPAFGHSPNAPHLSIV